MRKFYQGYLVGILLLLSAMHGKSQVTNYTFSALSGTFTPITGGTDVATTVSAADFRGDAKTSVPIPIGFDFTFNGIDYSQVIAASDGFLSFNLTATTIGTNNLATSATARRPLLAPLWDDLDGNVTGSSAKYSTTGAVGSRVFTIEWLNWQWNWNATGNTISFQVKLYEGTNVIEYIYRQEAGNVTSGSASIGLSAAATGAGNYLSLNNSGASPTVSSTTETSNISIRPATGQVYRFTPPPPPAIDLGITGISGLPTSACPNPSVPVSVTIKNSGANAIDFSTTPATVTVNVTGASTQTLTVTLASSSLAPGTSLTIPVFPNANFTAGGTHNLAAAVVVAGDGLASNNTRTGSVAIIASTTSPWSEGFSTTSVPAGWNTTGWTIDATHGRTTNGIYRNLWGSATTGLFNTLLINNVGASDVLNFDYRVVNFDLYPATATTGNWGNFKVQVSTDCGSTYTDLATIDQTNHVVATTWATKAYSLAAFAGQNIVIRISATRTNGDFYIDFDNFAVQASCIGTPAAGTTTASIASTCIGGSSNLALSGATSGVSGLQYQWQSSSDGISFTDIASASSSTYSATNITASTYFRAKVSCANGGTTVESVPVQVTVLAPQTVPYNEGFESLTTFGAGVLPGCMSTVTTAGIPFTTANTPVRGSVGARTGTNYVWSRWSSDGWLFTPGIQLTAGVSYDFSFYYRQTDAETGFTLTAAFGTANSAAGMTNVLGTITNPVNVDYQQAKYSFVPATTGVYFMGIRSNATFNPWYIMYDDISVTATPPCSAPGSISAANITTTGASINFTSPGNNFIVEYGAPGFTPGTGAAAGTGGTIVTGTASGIALTGLLANTAYDVYIRQVCGAVYSANSAMFNFRTLCEATNLPYVENFDAVTLPALPLCTQLIDVNGATTWTTIAAPTGYTGNTLRYQFDATAPGDDWFFTRGLNLTAGTTYRLVYRYGNNSTFFTEKMKVTYGTAATVAAMTTVLKDYTAINTNTPTQDTVLFTPATTGVHYIGFHAYSAPDEFSLYLDDISVIKAPVLDVSPVAIVTPPTTCPINLATIQGSFRNMTIVPLNLATNPVTVTMTITGAGTGILTGTLNTGTIAPGATATITMTPTFNFSSGGTYNFAVATTLAGDEVAANDNYTTSVVVNAPPAAPTVTPAAPTVCANTVQMLTASGSSATASGTIGTGTGTSTTVTPYKGFWGGQKAQYLYTAAELQAMGLSAGSTINSISFNVRTFNSPYTFNGFTIAMKNTSTANLTTTLEGGTTTVLTPTSFTLSGTAPFDVSHTLTTPFVWDGTSNLLVETCFNNNNGGGSSTNSAAVATSTTTGKVVYFSSDNNATVCSAPGTGTTSADRPNITIGYTGTANYSWSPVAGLFTDAAATVAYTGAPAAVVYAKTATAQTYTVTATSGFGCTSTSTVAVNITATPVITTEPVSRTGCTGGSATFTVAATGAGLSYQWRRDGVNIGTNSASLTLNNLTPAAAGTIDVIVSGTCAPADTSVAVTLTVTDNNWIGTSNSDWNNPLNWCGGIPTASMNVTIPAGTPFQPIVAGNAPVNNLTVANGATVTIAASGRLIASGNITNNGTFNSTAGSIEFVGTTNQSVGAITAANIIMNGTGGVTLGGNMNVGTALTMTNGNITLGSFNLVMTGGTTGSVNSHIVTNGSGRVTANNVTAATVVFPVGATATTYNPVLIANGGGRNYTVGVATGLPTTPSLANAARAINRTWSIAANTVPTTPVSITLQYADGDANTSATPTANMEAGVAGATNWLTVTNAGGVAPFGTATARQVGFQTLTLGNTILANIGGVNFPTAITSVDADITSVQLMPNLVGNETVLRVKTIRTTKVNWQVIDGNGRTVMLFNRQVFAGQNDLVLQLGHLAAGQYYLVGSTDKGAVMHVKFVRK